MGGRASWVPVDQKQEDDERLQDCVREPASSHPDVVVGASNAKVVDLRQLPGGLVLDVLVEDGGDDDWDEGPDHVEEGGDRLQIELLGGPRRIDCVEEGSEGEHHVLVEYVHDHCAHPPVVITSMDDQHLDKESELGD